MRNILKDSTDERYQRINVTNKTLIGNVLVVPGGLALLCYGPAAFTLSSNGQYLESTVKWVMSRLRQGQVSRKQVLRWLGKYVQFLEDLAAALVT